ncbi:universal stress protein [Hippea maritima]|uniref:Universal stress protein n=1 Tax=Hippea maritima (strain ATCC 700847 / DSM 10411 / MH2) TaxID=760142 RepID=F2LWG5_HIPMA|nr:universal stress protein [Hippea maritima]AEA34074.1 UspA domain-containing protein [Hippea maritima DSM 10411]
MNGISVRKILAPTDLSEASIYALSYAKAMSDKFDAKLYIYHCITDINSYVGYVPSFPAEQIVNSLREEAIKEIEHIRNRYNIQDAEVVIEVGEAAKSIVEFSKKNGIDIIVMGAHGRSGLERFMFGSVTEKVMRLSEIPVLVVKTPH